MLASAASLRLSWSLPEAIARLGSPLLFAIRLWASVCLSLFAAFWLGLDRPYWAGGTAARRTCQMTTLGQEFARQDETGSMKCRCERGATADN
jgi:hypothetical protein